MELLATAMVVIGFGLFFFGFMYQVVRFGDRFDPELSHASMGVGVMMVVMGTALWTLL